MAKKNRKLGRLNIEEMRNLINKKAGMEIAFDLTKDNPTQVKEWVPTGSRWLDSIICRGQLAGIPAGKIVEIAGLEGSGKSYMAAQIAGNAQKMGIDVVYFDSESAIDPEFLANAGCDIDNILLASIKKEFPDVKTDTIYLDKETDTKNSYDLALLLEVLEHIEDFEAVLKNISEMKFKYLLISVPNEPFFRGSNLARLKYLKRLGNTPGHVNNFTYLKFRLLIKKYFKDDLIEFKICWIWNFAFIKRSK